MIFRGRKKWAYLVWIFKRQVINYFIVYHILLSFKFEKLYELRQKKRGFLHTIRYKCENKGTDKLCGNCTADPLLFVGYIAALERLKINPLTYNGKRG